MRDGVKTAVVCILWFNTVVWLDKHYWPLVKLTRTFVAVSFIAQKSAQGRVIECSSSMYLSLYLSIHGRGLIVLDF